VRQILKLKGCKSLDLDALMRLSATQDRANTAAIMRCGENRVT
jgi:hypothetical protein